jgi:hypothetical protein
MILICAQSKSLGDMIMSEVLAPSGKFNVTEEIGLCA